MNKSNFFLAVFTTIISVYKKSTPKVDLVPGVYHGHWYAGATEDLAICTIERTNEHTVKLNFNPLTQYGYKIDGINVEENKNEEATSFGLFKDGFLGCIEINESKEDQFSWTLGSTRFVGTRVSN